ncbi:hypothetical protein AVEN_120232-1 [Araneus ventricosus]|uniref:Uncharacterized protein n=1 Tax=Araneus ventricosus TaxID=182803 RepID=A0A4Y2RLX4_ARAVE|nr:hypothetical protein AVEN_120232-1 [Araneus ventricosus]
MRHGTSSRMKIGTNDTQFGQMFEKTKNGLPAGWNKGKNDIARKMFETNELVSLAGIIRKPMTAIEMLKMKNGTSSRMAPGNLE